MGRTKDRYASSPAYRDMMRKKSKLQYWAKQPIRERPPLSVLQTELYAEIEIKNPHDRDYGKRVRVPFYTIAGVAKLLGVTTATVRKYEEERGWLPRSVQYYMGNAEEHEKRLEQGGTKERRARGYTYDQVRAMWELFPLLNFPPKRTYDGEGKLVDEELREYYHRLHERWKEMPDGVRVKPADADVPQEKAVPKKRTAKKRTSKRKVAAKGS